MNVFYSRGDTVEIAAESLPCIIAISVYDETWICLTSPGQHKGLNSKRGTQGPSWRPAQLRSTSQPPPAYCCLPSLPGYEPLLPPSPPYTIPSNPINPPSTTRPTPSLCVSSASQSYPTPTPTICPVHLIRPSPSPDSMRRQHCGLSCVLSFHSVTALLPCSSSNTTMTISVQTFCFSPHVLATCQLRMPLV